MWSVYQQRCPRSNMKHSEQKVLVTLFPLKSPNTHRTHSMQGQIQEMAFSQDMELVCWEKSQCCFSSMRTAGLPPLPQGQHCHSLPLACKRGLRLPMQQATWNISNPSCNLHKVSSLCVPNSAQSAMVAVAEG